MTGLGVIHLLNNYCTVHVSIPEVAGVTSDVSVVYVVDAVHFTHIPIAYHLDNGVTR